MSATTVKNYIGRCGQKGCDYAAHIGSDLIVGVEGWNGVTPGGLPVRVGNYGVYGRCPANHKVFGLKLVKGTYSDKHTCDSRCTNAKGHDCTCSCGGLNHGRGYAITEVKSFVQPELAPEPAPVRSVDRGHGEVVRNFDNPTEPQLKLIATLARDAGVPTPMVASRREASDTINRLKGQIRAALPDATPPQVNFVQALLDQRDVPDATRTEVESLLAIGLKKSEASRWINALKELPYTEVLAS